jgi:SNF family Na+-dependent transporter
MKDQKIWFWSLVDAVGVFVYVMGVVFIITNGDKIFGQMQNFWGPVAFLLLFVFSALMCGLLVFGRPVYLYLNNFKKEAIKMFLFTVVNIFAITLLALCVNIIFK